MQETAANTAPVSVLTGLFFVSGFASLVYQVSWQRVLFAAFGSDLESVTIVVSAFMLGLGGGALCGGWLADRLPTRALAMFCGCEAGIGLYGLISFALMRWIGDALSLLPCRSLPL
jgi:MFS family permease